MDIIKAKQFRAFSAQYGTIVGLFWILSFSCYIIGLGHPLVANLGFLFGICSIFVAGYLIRHFRRNVFDFKFLPSWRMSLLIFTYASLLLAAAQFIYFRYIDQGMLANTYAELLKQPESRQLLEAMMPGDDVQAVTTRTIELLQYITPIEITINFLVYNIILSLLLSIPAAWIDNSGNHQKNIKQ